MKYINLYAAVLCTFVLGFAGAKQDWLWVVIEAVLAIPNIYFVAQQIKRGCDERL